MSSIIRLRAARALRHHRAWSFPTDRARKQPAVPHPTMVRRPAPRFARLITPAFRNAGCLVNYRLVISPAVTVKKVALISPADWPFFLPHLSLSLSLRGAMLPRRYHGCYRGQCDVNRERGNDARCVFRDTGRAARDVFVVVDGTEEQSRPRLRLVSP